MRAEFNVLDVLKFEVQEDWPDLPNLVLNPSGEGGAWGWTVEDGVTVSGPSPYVRLLANAAGDWLQFQVLTDLEDAGGPLPGTTAWSASITPTTAGMQVRAAVDVLFIDDAPSAGAWRLHAFGPGVLEQWEFPDPLVVGVNELPPTDLPVGTNNLLLIYRSADGAAAGHKVRFKDAWMVAGDAASVAASDPLSEPPWVDITGQGHEITIEREDLNVGSLNATIYDSTLDPAASGLIRPGKRARVRALIDDEWEDLINVLLDNPSTAYLVSDPTISDLKRVRIQLAGSDANGTLANEQRPNGVSTIDELPAVLLGTGVPFNVNGSTDAINPQGVITVAVNDSASALDQIVVTRDSVLGYAWLDRTGVLQAWDRDDLPATGPLAIDETVYDPDGTNIDFDVERCFNTIYVTVVRLNPGTGETEEVKYGPYVDSASVRQWRTRVAEFKVQGINEDLVEDYASAILALNSTPTKRINQVTIPMRTATRLNGFALVDLYDLASLSNELADVTGQLSRVTSLKHRIKADHRGGRWWLDLGFTVENSVATPQVTPSPTVGGSRTIGQLLRPVGEVTMWFGAKADIPAGWLPLDGTAFDGDQYPALEAVLGAEVLPDFTDRFPIGAGTKALGTSGGSVETSDPIADADGWAVDNTGGNNAPRLSEYNAHTHNLTPPYRALWFIVRAA